MFNNNVRIQKNLLLESVNSNVNLFIFMSSISVYEGIRKNKNFMKTKIINLKVFMV